MKVIHENDFSRDTRAIKLGSLKFTSYMDRFGLNYEKESYTFKIEIVRPEAVAKTVFSINDSKAASTAFSIFNRIIRGKQKSLKENAA